MGVGAGVDIALSPMGVGPNVMKSWPSMPARFGRVIFRRFRGPSKLPLLAASVCFCVFLPLFEDDDIDDAGVDNRSGVLDAEWDGIWGFAGIDADRWW